MAAKIKNFSELGLSEQTLQAITKKGFEEPTAIQALTIPAMLNGNKDIIAQAQTGTGKTAAFGLPLIDRIDHKSNVVQALVLVPTRELSLQVAEEINSIKGSKELKVVPIYGGQSIDQQLRHLKKGVQIVVGTPGRIIDHIKRKTLKLGAIEYLILDEADEMLNMGFLEDMEEIIRHTNPEKRTLLFSATMPHRIKELSEKYLKGYQHLVVKADQLVTNLTEQIYYEVKMSDKFESLCRIIDIEDNFYAMVFCRTKSDVDTVVSHLVDRGYDAGGIHGDIAQAQREQILNKFRKQKTNILVATDIAARGIDINNLSHVINYSLPQDPEAYVHRIGRTGRAGNQGIAITFITPSEYKRLMFIRKIAKTDIRKSELPKIKDILNSKKKKIMEDIAYVANTEVGNDYLAMAKKLLDKIEPTQLVASILSYCFDDDLNPDNYNEINQAKGRELDMQGKARLFVAKGRKDKLDPKKLVKLIMTKVSIKGHMIKDVQIMENFSFISVPFDKAEEIIVNFKEKGGKSLVSHAKN